MREINEVRERELSVMIMTRFNKKFTNFSVFKDFMVFDEDKTLL